MSKFNNPYDFKPCESAEYYPPSCTVPNMAKHSQGNSLVSTFGKVLAYMQFEGERTAVALKSRAPQLCNELHRFGMYS